MGIVLAGFEIPDHGSIDAIEKVLLTEGLLDEFEGAILHGAHGQWRRRHGR